MSFSKNRMRILAALVSICLCTTCGLAGESGSPVTAKEAEQIALSQAGGGSIAHLVRYDRGDLQYYRLKVLADDGVYIVEVNEKDGQVLRMEKKNSRKKNRYVGGGDMPATQGVTQAQAQVIALERTNGGTVVQSEIERKRNGRVIYEFKIVNNGVKSEIEIDAENGVVRKAKQKYQNKAPLPVSQGAGGADAALVSMHPEARLNAEAAMALALERTGGGYVSEYELDRDDGRLIHEMTIMNENTRYEVEIDDASGAIIEFSAK